MNKKTIAAFLGGIALTVAISTATPVIKDAVAPKVDAAGTCPITLQPIQSTGNLVFSPFSFYSSDLANLRAELNDLGAWADGEISSIQSDVSNGKSSLRDKMVSKGASSSLPAVPSFAQLKDAVDDIYSEGKSQGRIEYVSLAKANMYSIDCDTNDSVRVTFKNSSGNPIVVCFYEDMRGDNKSISASGPKFVLENGESFSVRQDSAGATNESEGNFVASFTGIYSSASGSIALDSGDTYSGTITFQ